MSDSRFSVFAVVARRLLLAALFAVVITPVAADAKAKSQPAPAATYDVSYPQCGKTLPSSPTGGIVGVNGGVVFSANPCLGTEWSWALKGASVAPAFYANTADPGPAYSSHWPAGQTAPMACDGSNSTACSYDYGWNAAKDSYADAAKVTATPGAYTWWLDVETGNSWQTLESAYGQTPTARANDQAALAGAVAELKGAGVTRVGMYSTSYQWGQITGDTGTQFATAPVWVAGTGTQSTAIANCSSTSFTGGPVMLTQYAQSGYDADHWC